MTSTFKKLYDLLNGHERRRVYLLLAMISCSGILDMIGIASILPFLAAVSDPEKFKANEMVAKAYEWGHFSSDQGFLIFMGFVVLGLTLVALTAKIVTTYAIAHFSHMRNHSISSRLLAAYLRQPYVWFLNHHSADLGKSVLYETERIIHEALLPLMRVVAYAASMICLVGLLLVVQPLVALVSALTMGGTYLLIFYLARRTLTRLGQTRAADNALRYKVAHEAIAGIKDVKLLGLENTYQVRFNEPSRRVASSASVSQVVGELPRHLLEVVAFGGMIALILTLLLTGSGKIGDILPTLGVFAFAGLRMFPAMQQIYHALTLMKFVAPLLDNVHRDTVATGARLGYGPVPAPVAPMHLNKALELRDVCYRYPTAESSAVNGLSLRIAAKSMVGIVGGSGAGKTTVVDVMLGLLPTQVGQMLVDGVEVTAANLRAWQNSIGYVPQHIYLLDDTVAANIAFGIPPEEIDMAAVERASRIANLHDFVMEELSEGYQSTVGERGIRLSGGQRQRIGIARALYHDPDVLIFDEATSALDNLTERAVMSAVNNLGNSKTIIMIAHRLSTVRKCDVIFLLDGGKVAAQGTFDGLVESNEKFRSMAADPE